MRKLSPDASGYVSFGTVARDMVGIQCQYASRYVKQFPGYPYLGEGLRFQNLGRDYHDIRVHLDDVPVLVERLVAHRAEVGGFTPDEYRSYTGIPTAQAVAAAAAPPTAEECRDLAGRLRELQHDLNRGRGVSCVRSIATYLDRGDFAAARAILSNDGDKIRNYPEIETLLFESLGNPEWD